MGHVGSKTRSPGQILENSFTKLLLYFKTIAFRFRPPSVACCTYSNEKRELLKIFCLRWAFQGPLGPLVVFTYCLINVPLYFVYGSVILSLNKVWIEFKIMVHKMIHVIEVFGFYPFILNFFIVKCNFNSESNPSKTNLPVNPICVYSIYWQATVIGCCQPMF